MNDKSSTSKRAEYRRAALVSVAVMVVAGLLFSTSFVSVNAASLTVHIKPDKGIVNRSITISGGGFLASATITIKFDSVTVTSTTSNTTGGFSTTFKVPQATAGAHIVSVTDGTNSISKAFTVTTNLALKPKSGLPGASVAVTGSGYAASSTVKITFNGASVKSIKANSTGGFTTAITVPNDPAAAYTVVGTDGKGNTHSATFTIT